MDNLETLINEVRNCKICAEHLPFPPKPIFRVSPTAVLLIVGQAPGIRVYKTGIPWNDPSGDRLRKWLNLDRDLFYDVRKIAIIPTAMCYPGKGARGDLPPRPECAPLWHPQFRKYMPNLKMTLLVGSHAQAFYLKGRLKKTMAETVKSYKEYLPEFFPLPHPSPRNMLWFKQNKWLETEVIPALREIVSDLLKNCPV